MINDKKFTEIVDNFLIQY